MIGDDHGAQGSNFWRNRQKKPPGALIDGPNIGPGSASVGELLGRLLDPGLGDFGTDEGSSRSSCRGDGMAPAPSFSI